VKPNDVIVSLNGEPVDEMNQFRIRVSSTPPGSEINLTLLRDGREQQVRLTLGEFQPQEPR
jgi:S1-C subfamily serine protease